MDRRRCLKSTLGAIATTGLVARPAAADTTARAALPGRFQLCEIFSPGQPEKLRLMRQIGVTHVIAGVAGVLARVRREEYVDALTRVRSEFAASGMTIVGVESHPVPAEKIKLGLPGREEEIENYKAAIDALARVGVPMICYNFMAGLGWYRTRTDVAERGGALTSEFDADDAERQGPTEWGEVSEERMWANMEYFQKALIPIAERAGVRMALHPDDPPISPLRGIGRILTSADAYRRVMDMVPSPVNGVTFCQANFRAMGEDIEALAREWCGKQKIFFVHFRDIEGKGRRFRETFHDNGPTDMVGMLRAYAESGFSGPIRPDHAPTLEGEANANPGYAMMGKVLAFGYMKGIMEAQGIAYE
jgi:mannonate dehydratase